MILCIEVICISYAQNVMYSTPACALAKSPKKICLKFLKMKEEKSSRIVIEYLTIDYCGENQQKNSHSKSSLFQGKRYTYSIEEKTKIIFNICNFFPHHTRQLKFGLPIDVPCAERSKSEIRVILNTIKLNTTEKSIQAFEKIVYMQCKREHFFYLQMNRNHFYY